MTILLVLPYTFCISYNELTIMTKVQSTDRHTLPKTTLNHPSLSHGLKNGTAACDRDALSGEHCLNVITYQ